MPPKPTPYTQEIERHGRTVTVIDKMNGYDYLDLWELHNAEEVVGHHAQRELDAHYKAQRELDTQEESSKELGKEQ